MTTFLEQLKNAPAPVASPQVVNRRGNGRQPAADQKPAELYLNIGVEVPGEDGQRFMSPNNAGIALDYLKPKKAMGQNAEFNGQVAALNQWLLGLMQYASTLKPGETSPVLKMSCQIRRITDKADETPAVDLTAISALDPELAKLLAAKPATEPAVPAAEVGDDGLPF